MYIPIETSSINCMYDVCILFMKCMNWNIICVDYTLSVDAANTTVQCVMATLFAHRPQCVQYTERTWHGMESGPQGEREPAEPLLPDASAVGSLDLEDVLKYDFSIYCTKALPTDLKNANGVCLLADISRIHLVLNYISILFTCF